eukprot:Protomagalhaensia_wolfi_Nauph_80__739@NODE_1421_length_1539_cov_4_590000_g1099_i0_p1_GENE_NODE_1421_length_1539_cov_4_590000_g1099_i0NODE_1421_length_1539_cov_4_590000_g1099_i0_p1_ORF_typecomplete_len161_score1_96CactinC_cactus/PF09732_9/0_077_NODE_1421_length_1539_cov_4_590000_g1099_i0427909
MIKKGWIQHVKYKPRHCLKVFQLNKKDDGLRTIAKLRRPTTLHTEHTPDSFHQQHTIGPVVPTDANTPPYIKRLKVQYSWQGYHSTHKPKSTTSPNLINFTCTHHSHMFIYGQTTTLLARLVLSFSLGDRNLSLNTKTNSEISYVEDATTQAALYGEPPI